MRHGMGLRMLYWLERRGGAFGLTPLLLPPVEWLAFRRTGAGSGEPAAAVQEHALLRLLRLLLLLRGGAVLDAGVRILGLCALADRQRRYLGFDACAARCAEAEQWVSRERLPAHTVLPVRLAPGRDMTGEPIMVMGDTVVQALRAGPVALIAVAPEEAGALHGCARILRQDRPYVLCTGGPPPPLARTALEAYLWFRLEADTSLVCAEPLGQGVAPGGDYLALPEERAGELIGSYGREPGGNWLFA